MAISTIGSAGLSPGAAASNLPTASSTTYNVRYLVVAGGGSGGTGAPGGGGAGGMIESVATVTSGTGYTVTIGAGGTVPGANTKGNNGGDSVFGAFATATGGGGGGAASQSANTGEIGRAHV